MEGISEFVKQNMYLIAGIAVVLVAIFVIWIYFKNKAKGGSKTQAKTQEVYMIMPEGQILPLNLALDYASSYSNFYMEVNNVRRSWLVLTKFQRTVRGTRRNKIIADYRSLVPYAPGASKEDRKVDLEWAEKILTQIGGVQHDVTALLAPKLELKNKLRDNLVTIGLMGLIALVIMAILFIVLK